MMPMNRFEEVEHKHAQLRALMEQHGVGALWLRKARNVAWFTAGTNPVIAADGDNGAYSALVTADKRVLLTNPIEAPRIRAEDKIEELGFELRSTPWYQPYTPPEPGLATDDGALADALAALRLVMTEAEMERARALGKDTGAALEAAARAIRPGDTEYQIAARMAANCRETGGFALVTLVASDERIFNFRHPYATAKTLDKYAMLVVCNRREGLVISATRLVYFGALPDDLAVRNRKVAALDAAAMTATRPGRTQGEAFADIQAAYAAQGEADQWQYHHQGGSAGYGPREVIATPTDTTPIRSGMIFAWNPSIPGCKSEDTILVSESGFEILSQTGDYPTLDAQANGQTVKRPAILAL
jgi:antitoxin VapB